MASRNPQQTRERLLQCAFNEMHAHGYQGMRVDDVLRESGLRKGAFYHHFDSKAELAYAVLEEEIKPLVESIWIEPLAGIVDPVNDIAAMLDELGKRVPPSMIRYGCPLNNLAQEMSAQDDAFNERIQAIFNEWTTALSAVFESAKRSGYVSSKIDSEAVALFFIAALEGCIGIFKLNQSAQQWDACRSQIKIYLNSLRP